MLLTLGGQNVQALQAVPAGRGEAAPLGQVALPAGQHGGRTDDARGGHLPHPLIQLLYLSLLGRLQGLHLRQVSEQGHMVTTVSGRRFLRLLNK